MEVRRRRVIEPEASPKTVELIQQFDVFPKLPSECKKSTASGGGVTIVTFFVIFVLVVSEVLTFLEPNIEYTYNIDMDAYSTIRVNIDLTVAMNCDSVGIDIVDESGSSLRANKDIKAIETRFELSQNERNAFEHHRSMAQLLREHHHAIHSRMWQHGNDKLSASPLSSQTSTVSAGREATDKSLLDACRFRGTFEVHKVSGNLHIVYGLSIDLDGGSHVHLAPLFSTQSLNYSHRIHHLSFGNHLVNHVNPLDGEEVIAEAETSMFQYFLKIVPTQLSYDGVKTQTFQYSVATQARVIDHSADSHGVPGIFFRYDTFPVLVNVVQSREPLCHLLIRLAALVGGVFTTVGLIRQACGGLPELLLQNTKLGRRIHGKLHQRSQRLFSLLGKQPFESNLNNTLPLNPDSDT